MNEAVTMKNCVTLNGEGKRQVKKFTRKEFWKCIECILSAVTYGKKGRKLWSEVSKGFGKHEILTLRRNVCGTTNLHKLCCARYCHLFFYDFDWIILSYTTFFEYLPIFIHLQVCGIYLTRFKEFRKFWPFSFVDPLVKVTNNFWKIRGLIDGFNESRRQIASGREKNVDESMSAIRFHTTLKGDLMHYSYIFSKPEPLVPEMKNVANSRLGTMLHLEIQQGKEAMKKSTYQSELGGTAACMKRLAIVTELNQLLEK